MCSSSEHSCMKISDLNEIVASAGAHFVTAAFEAGFIGGSMFEMQSLSLFEDKSGVVPILDKLGCMHLQSRLSMYMSRDERECHREHLRQTVPTLVGGLPSRQRCNRLRRRAYQTTLSM